MSRKGPAVTDGEVAWQPGYGHAEKADMTAEPSVNPWHVHWEQLDARDRETLQQIALRVAVGKTHGEVASELAITEGEVSRRMRDLRRAVRANIDADVS